MVYYSDLFTVETDWPLRPWFITLTFLQSRLTSQPDHGLLLWPFYSRDWLANQTMVYYSDLFTVETDWQTRPWFITLTFLQSRLTSQPDHGLLLWPFYSRDWLANQTMVYYSALLTVETDWPTRPWFITLTFLQSRLNGQPDHGLLLWPFYSWDWLANRTMVYYSDLFTVETDWPTRPWFNTLTFLQSRLTGHSDHGLLLWPFYSRDWLANQTMVYYSDLFTVETDWPTRPWFITLTILKSRLTGHSDHGLLLWPFYSRDWLANQTMVYYSDLFTVETDWPTRPWFITLTFLQLRLTDQPDHGLILWPFYSRDWLANQTMVYYSDLFTV